MQSLRLARFANKAGVPPVNASERGTGGILRYWWIALTCEQYP